MPASPLRSSPSSGPTKIPLSIRYRCGFPGCNKRYASTDGVRKHARKTHLMWLKTVDEGASSRDRHLESKPSTYCFKEEGPFHDDDAGLDEEPSPSLTPSLAPSLGSMSMSGPDGLPELPMLSLPEAANGQQFPLQSEAARNVARQVSGAMAAAAAACLAGQGPPPPLAWLLAQSAAAAAAQNNSHLNVNNIGAGGAPAVAPFPHLSSSGQLSSSGNTNGMGGNGMGGNGMGGNGMGGGNAMGPGGNNAMGHQLSAPPLPMPNGMPHGQMPPQRMPPMPPMQPLPSWMPSLSEQQAALAAQMPMTMPPMPPMHAAPTTISVNTTNPPSPINLGFDLAPSSNAGWDLPSASTDLAALFGVATGDEDEPSVHAKDSLAHINAQHGMPSMTGQHSERGMPQPLCLTPPQNSSLLTSTCVSPFELDKRPRDAAEGRKQADEAEEPLTSHQESEYAAFVNTLLAV